MPGSLFKLSTAALTRPWFSDFRMWCMVRFLLSSSRSSLAAVIQVFNVSFISHSTLFSVSFTYLVPSYTRNDLMSWQ